MGQKAVKQRAKVIEEGVLGELLSLIAEILVEHDLTSTEEPKVSEDSGEQSKHKNSGRLKVYRKISLRGLFAQVSMRDIQALAIHLVAPPNKFRG